MAEGERDLSALIPKVPDGELKVKLENLVYATRRSFQLIEPWSAAKSNHPQVELIIHDVKQQGEHYYSALTNSVGASERGYSISNDCARLCESIMKGTTASDLKEFITDLRADAQMAHKDATAAFNMFRSVRRGLIDALNCIPSAVETLRLGGVDLNTVEFISIPDQLLKEAPPVKTEERLPVAVERMAVPKNDREARSQLFKSQLIVDQLVTHVDIFATWWSHLETMLDHMEETAKGLNPHQIVRLKVRGNLKDWNNVKEMYLHYKSTVTRLQDMFKQSLVKDGDVDEEEAEIQRLEFQQKLIEDKEDQLKKEREEKLSKDREERTERERREQVAKERMTQLEFEDWKREEQEREEELKREREEEEEFEAFLREKEEWDKQQAIDREEEEAFLEWEREMEQQRMKAQRELEEELAAPL